jgi:hypothetical protein
MRSRHDEITQVIRHHWDRRASTFDDEIGHSLVDDEQRNAWFDLLSRLAGRAPRRVLDVDAGLASSPSGSLNWAIRRPESIYRLR